METGDRPLGARRAAQVRGEAIDEAPHLPL